MNREVYVHADLDCIPRIVGRLYTRVRAGRESATFEYDDLWLSSPERFALEPALQLGPGPFHTGADRALFGAIGDSAPDRWGRVLMRRAERRRAAECGEASRTLFEVDFLLQVSDEARVGALRFSEDAGGAFLAGADAPTVPPLIDLPRLLSAAERFVHEDANDEDLRLLVAPGSSLGGARPKASVRENDGRLAIAKFPHKDDDWNAVLWECVALDLADKAGINVAPFRPEKVAGNDVILVTRFDRNDDARIPFLSAMSMIGAKDNETRSYLEVADAIRQHGARTSEDLAELWRRIVFTILISNVDDHMRNHGFLYSSELGWTLSPAYDINPVPTDVRPRVLSTAINEDDTTAQLSLALEVSEYFDLNQDRAAKIAAEVGQVVSRWRHVASEFGITAHEIQRMASAFEHADLKASLDLD